MARLPAALESLLCLPGEQRRIGPFMLVRQLGRGGFAPVWLAKEVYGGTELRTAAVKLFSLEAPTEGPGDSGSTPSHYGARIVAEAQALCQVEHPGIVRFYSLPTDDARGVMGLAMEHVAGTPLDRRLAERRTLGIAETLAVGTMVASALSAVHRAGLVHRDVKPANVVESAGAYKLIDFGIAAAVEAARGPRRARRNVVLFDGLLLEVSAAKSGVLPGAVTLSSSGLETSGAMPSSEAGPLGAISPPSGTVGYIDPVCVATGAPATAASDLYALGAMLFECVTGKLPAGCGPPGQGVDWAVVEGRASAPSLATVAPGAPPALVQLIDALLAPERRDRPRSAEWVVVELDHLRNAIGGLERALPPEREGPFRGLGRFEENDRAVYFGRTSEVASALEVLRGHGTLALVGPSGSGKSSLARAGILPRVAEGALGGWPNRWDTAVVVPGSDARAAITAALGALNPPVADAARKSPEALLEALAERAHATDRGLVLLVDQLEELATLGSGESRTWTGLVLARLGERALPGVRVVETVRRDLLDLVLGLGPLGNALVRGSLLVAPIAEAVWSDVIDQALSAYGYELEDDALRAELLAELEGTADAMPLVQFAVTELWRKRDTETRRITRASLRSIGGIAGALDRHAEATLARFVEAHPGGARTARQVLLTLTTPQGTRASRPMAELEQAGGPGTAALLDRLEAARLVVLEAEGVALAHEALLAQWGTLREWMAEARADRLLAEEVERDAARWQEDPGSVSLWTPPTPLRRWLGVARTRRLEAAEDMLRRGTVRVSPAGVAFLRASRRAERRSRAAVAGAVLALVAAAVSAGVIYVHDVGAQKARADAARDRAEVEARRADEGAAEARQGAARARNAGRLAAAREQEHDPTTMLALLREIEPGPLPRGWSEIAREALGLGVARTVLPHGDLVRNAAWSPDGRHIATACEDGVVRVWNADGQGQPLLLGGHDLRSPTSRAWLSSVAWSPDGRLIASASEDKTLRLWNADGSGQPIVLRGHGSGVTAVAWSPDSRRVVSAAWDGTVRVWNADGSGQPLLLDGRGDRFNAVAWSPNGRRIASGSMNKTVQVWNADGSGRPLVLRGHESWVMSVAWSPDSRRIASGSYDRTIRLWDADGAGKPVVLRGHEKAVRSAQFSPEGGRIVSASEDGTVDVWSADGSGPPVVLRGHASMVYSAAWSPDGRFVVSGSNDGTARVWLVDDPSRPLVLRGHDDRVYMAAWSPDGRKIASASDDRTVRIWNALRAEPPLILRGHENRVMSAAWSPDGLRIVSGSFDSTVRVWNADGSGEPLVLRGHGDRVCSATWSPDGRRIASGATDNTVRVWNADGSGDPLVLRGHSQSVYWAAWSPDGRRIASASPDSTVRVWNADGTGEPLVLRGHDGSVYRVAWSPDGRKLVSCSEDKTVRVWNADGTDEPLVLRGHEGKVASVAFSPDGRRILSASYDKTVRIWNADGTGDPILLRGSSFDVEFAAWSPDGTKVAAASDDKTIWVWSDLSRLDGPDDPKLWTATAYCMPIEVRQRLLDAPDEIARADLARCERRVHDALGPDAAPP